MQVKKIACFGDRGPPFLPDYLDMEQRSSSRQNVVKDGIVMD